MHGKFAAAKVSTFVVSDFCVVWDFDCQRLCITPLGGDRRPVQVHDAADAQRPDEDHRAAL